MRRVVGVVLAGLGAFLIVGALMCRFYLPGQVVKFPLNEYNVSRLSGTNVSYFSPQTGKEVNGATVRAVSTTQGDVPPPAADKSAEKSLQEQQQSADQTESEVKQEAGSGGGSQ